MPALHHVSESAQNKVEVGGGPGALTMIQGIHTTAQRQLIGTPDPREDSKNGAGDPVSEGIAEEVDLLLR